MIFNIIVAHTFNKNGIGFKNKLPWKLKNELENFKKTIPTLKNIEMNIKIAKAFSKYGISYVFLKGINCQKINNKYI